MHLTLASGLTLSRVLFLPPLLLLLLQGQRWPAFGLLLVVLLLDLADGALARLRREVTELGRLLDPLMDKLVFLTIFAALVWMGELHWIALALLAGFQLGILIGAIFWWKLRQNVPPARTLGKIASFALSLGLLAVFLLPLLEVPHSEWLIYAGIALLFLAGLDYLFNFLRLAKTPRGKAEIPEEEGR